MWWVLAAVVAAAVGVPLWQVLRGYWHNPLGLPVGESCTDPSCVEGGATG